MVVILKLEVNLAIYIFTCLMTAISSVTIFTLESCSQLEWIDCVTWFVENIPVENIPTTRSRAKIMFNFYLKKYVLLF